MSLNHRDDTNVHGLYYQNGIEEIHAIQKCMQNFKKLDVLSVVQSLQRLEQRQGSQEVRVLYRAGKYVLAEPHNGSKTQEMKGIPRVKSTEKM